MTEQHPATLPNETPLAIDDEVRLVTISSVWLLRPTSYCRLPRTEHPRAARTPALRDGIWHPHIGAWVENDPNYPLPRVRILPAGRPPGSFGIHTGDIHDSQPALPQPRRTP